MVVVTVVVTVVGVVVMVVAMVMAVEVVRVRVRVEFLLYRSDDAFLPPYLLGVSMLALF